MTFIFFAACVAVMTLTVIILLPETKGVPIEEVRPSLACFQGHDRPCPARGMIDDMQQCPPCALVLSHDTEVLCRLT